MSARAVSLEESLPAYTIVAKACVSSAQAELESFPLASHICANSIEPVVIVPVLSKQTTSVRASVSTQ